MFDSSRTAMLLGEEGLNLLAQKRVAVFGVGGVGGYTCEALARAGVGALDIFDRDTVAPGNLNRQIIALQSTLGQPKVAVMKARIADINPGCRVVAHEVFYTPETAENYPFDGYDYVVDAVDNITAKLELITRAKAAGVPVISCMGTGNKLHPERLALMDISKTSVCPLARVMRKEIKDRRLGKVRVVCSTEPPLKPRIPQGQDSHLPGSVSFVPGCAGLMIAGEVVRSLLGLEG